MKHSTDRILTTHVGSLAALCRRNWSIIRWCRRR